MKVSVLRTAYSELIVIDALTCGPEVLLPPIAGIGIWSIGSCGFASNWQPVPSDLPGREAIGNVSGALLLLSGLWMIVDMTSKPAALIMTLSFLGLLVLPLLPRVFARTSLEGAWLGIGESFALGCGSLAVFVSLQREPSTESPPI